METITTIIGGIAAVIEWAALLFLPFALIYFIYKEAIEPFFDLFKKDDKKSNLNSK